MRHLASIYSLELTRETFVSLLSTPLRFRLDAQQFVYQPNNYSVLVRYQYHSIVVEAVIFLLLPLALSIPDM